MRVFLKIPPQNRKLNPRVSVRMQDGMELDFVILFTYIIKGMDVPRGRPLL
jgi:hypothetical protein